MSARDEPFETAVAEQASEWYIRHRNGELTSTENDEFMAWLQTSPLHVREYLAAAAVSRQLTSAAERLNANSQHLLERARQWLRTNENVIPLRPVRTEIPAPVLVVKRRLRIPARLIAGVAVLAIVLGGVGYWSTTTPGASGWPRVIEVPRGEQRTVQLRDGSVMHLNADTRVRVRYSGNQRLVELEHGQALFSAAHEKVRPFMVRAGGAEVVAIGTQFDVAKRSTRDAVTVTVVEGKVAVFERDPLERDSQGGSADRKSTATQLSAGQRLRLDPTRPRSGAENIDARVATAWLRRELIFSEERLGDVAEEFSRYGVPIEIENPALRDYRVSGVFNAYDTESFIAFLRRFGEVEEGGQAIRVRETRLPPEK
jgi:transmembrane sensor